MNKLPRKRIHATNAAKSMAYQNRLRDERAALKALAERVLVSDEPKEVIVAQLLEELPSGQVEALKRLASSQVAGTKLQSVAG